MHFLSSIALLALAQVGLANPRAAAAPLQVTNLNTFEPPRRPDTVNIYRVGFNVADPNDASTAFCETRWEYVEDGSGWPSEYLSNCTDPSYAFKFINWNNYADFALDVKHTTKKHGDHGKEITRFAQGLVSYDIVQCSHSNSGFSVCNQREGVEFPLAVYDEQKA